MRVQELRSCLLATSSWPRGSFCGSAAALRPVQSHLIGMIYPIVLYAMHQFRDRQDCRRRSLPMVFMTETRLLAPVLFLPRIPRSTAQRWQLLLLLDSRSAPSARLQASMRTRPSMIFTARSPDSSQKLKAQNKSSITSVSLAVSSGYLVLTMFVLQATESLACETRHRLRRAALWRRRPPL